MVSRHSLQGTRPPSRGLFPATRVAASFAPAYPASPIECSRRLRLAGRWRQSTVAHGAHSCNRFG